MNKKLVAVPLLVAIGLSICGFVYAHWTATVYINGNATTGYLMLGFYKKFPAEPPKYTEYWLNKTSGESVEGEYLGKDVGSGSAGLSGPIYCPQTGLSGYSELDITVNNAYPGYMPHVTFNLENLGTIPVDLKKFIADLVLKTKKGNWMEPEAPCVYGYESFTLSQFTLSSSSSSSSFFLDKQSDNSDGPSCSCFPNIHPHGRWVSKQIRKQSDVV